MTDHEATTLLHEALKYVESDSIKKWAMSDHNMPLWISYCKTAKGAYAHPRTIGTYIVCLAIGL